ncbi:MAG: CocE/NonD family hydrolase [Actinobacteria bacterium]|uniref:Unannotated protein n=1 Tax=freshwater metagenome TaxID=449393 RepID=A0A6J6PHE1_9ZZZZ|nr:CocE/NonD family hydrolase [Actinomycetota bacterium]
MTRRSARKARRWGFAPATHTYTLDQGVRIPMRDGVELAATHWVPQPIDSSIDGANEGPAPLVLMRTPYGRRIQPDEAMMLAERGYQVLVVSCRGTFDSGGERALFLQEPADGQDTLAWIEQQPWFPGRAVTAGGSYVGMTQWAIASDPPAWLRGHAMSVTTSEIRDGVLYPEGVFALETALTWMWALEMQERAEWRKWVGFLFMVRRDLRRSAAELPLRGAGRRLMGYELPDLTTWIDSEDPSADYWTHLGDFGRTREGMRPIAMTSGWFDLFHTAQLRDVARLQEAGVPFRLEIGPWHHGSVGLHQATLHLWYDFLERQLKPAQPVDDLGDDLPIRAHVGGTSDVVGLATWPPPSTEYACFPGSAGRLGETPSTELVVTYDFDPADPTPAAGGRTLNILRAGSKSQRRRESRDDVLVFTAPARTTPLTVIGAPSLRLRVRPSHDEVDYVATLCDVDARGRSRNVTDGVVRLTGASAVRDADGWLDLEIPLAGTAHRFEPGHAVRLQVSSGAHPIVPVNTGTGDALATAQRLVISRHEVAVGDGTWLSLPVHTPDPVRA